MSLPACPSTNIACAEQNRETDQWSTSSKETNSLFRYDRPPTVNLSRSPIQPLLPGFLWKKGSVTEEKSMHAAKYDVIFYPGGHATVIDLPQNPLSIKLTSDLYRAGKITAAVCHRTAALADSQGKSIFIGKSFTGFSDAEKEALNAVAWIPFLLQDKITALGGKYEKADELFGVEVVVDGNLYTEQNLNSAGSLAKEILAALNK
ncbi:class I glutamine amidotransferase-like protein [Mycena floridula]|nr:class I glutamine amidotransferase-like protein [Mycena floridula]